MADTPDTARRIAEFVNYLDTLTAKLAEVEAERDALRALVIEVAGSGVESIAERRYITVQMDIPTWTAVQEIRGPQWKCVVCGSPRTGPADWCGCTQPESSPSPVEGGQ
jgi:hypothetical protein